MPHKPISKHAHLHLLVALCSVLACADGGADDANTGADSIQLSDEEIDVLLTELGPLEGPPPPDPSNSYADDPDAARLGRELFYSPRYSGNGEIACTTCHVPEHAYQDRRGEFTSQGFGAKTPRHTLSIIGASYGSAGVNSSGHWQFWDGRKDTQWAQALGSPESPIGMGGSRSKVVRVMIEDYRDLYESIFGLFPDILFDEDGVFVAADEARPGEPSWDALDPEVQEAISRAYSNFGKAIAAFERTVVCEDSRFDAFWRDVSAGDHDSDALSDQEKLGLRLFMGKGGCLRCHRGPNFTDSRYYNLGIDQSGLGEPHPPMDEGRAAGIERAMTDPFNCMSSYSDHPDPAQCAVANVVVEPSDSGAFKTPSLRCVQSTGPYMHTGSFSTLDSVLEHLTRGGDPGGYSGESAAIPLDLTEEEQAAIVAFMQSLGAEVVYREAGR